MSGYANTDNFMLAQGTLMVGPAADVMALNEADHSLGLVKNIQFNPEMTYQKLSQGTGNNTVYSVNTNSDVRVSAEVFEFTARNLAYGQGIDASGSEFDVNSTTYSLGSDISGAGATFDVGSGEGSNFSAGDNVVIGSNNSDDFHVGKVASVATDTITLATGFELTADSAFTAANTKVYKMSRIEVGTNDNQPTLAAKIVTKLPNKEPLVLVFPKIRIERGLSLAFNSENFSNMPFEFVPYNLLPSDPHFNEFGRSTTCAVYRT